MYSAKILNIKSVLSSTSLAFKFFLQEYKICRILPGHIAMGCVVKVTE